MEFLSNVMQGAGDAKGSGWERLGAGLATAMSGGAGDRTESAAYQDTLLRGHRVQKALMDAQKASAEYVVLGQMRDAIRSMAVPQGMVWLRDFAGGAAVAGKAPDQVMQSLGYAQKNDLLRAATEDFAAGRIEDGQRKLGLYRGQPMELTKIEGNAQDVALTIDIGRQVSLYAFNDWALAFAGSVADLFTRSRATPPPGLSEAAIAALKTLRLGERVVLSGRMGEIAGSGLFDLSRLLGKSAAEHRQFLQTPRFVARIEALAASKQK